MMMMILLMMVEKKVKEIKLLAREADIVLFKIYQAERKERR